MANAVQVSCISRDTTQDADFCIDAIGGLNHDGSRWRLSLAQAIADVEAGTWSFFTQVGGVIAWVYVRERRGRKYLTTAPDGVAANNLLSLQECP